ncbi:MAG: MFS transporter [Acidimicrobiales bacterium]|jgi:EmrB/QacA subfamily drug resistance transporter
MEKKWWTLIAVCLGTFMLLLDVTIVNVALPDIQKSLHSSFSDLQWVVDAYALTLASLLLTAGSLADLFGRRLLFTIGLVSFTLGSLSCGLAESSDWLILSRAGQGIGGAIMFSTSLALLAQAFQGRERGVAFGVWGSITGAAVAIGPVIGGILTSGLSWKWIFFVNVPIGAFAIAVTAARVEESRQKGARQPDWAGFAVFTAALVSLVYALIRSGEKGWTETGVLVCFALAFVLLVAFVLQERHSTRAMFDLSLFRNHTFDGGAIAAFGLSASLFALLLYVVLYLQDGEGYSALGAGLRLLVISAGLMVAATVSGRLTQHVPVRLLIGGGLLLVGVGLLLMARLGPSSTWTVLVPGFVVAGVGAGMVNPPLASTAVGVVEPRRAGMASGINSTFRQVGISTGVAALGSIFGSEVTRQLRRNLGSVRGLAAQIPGLSKAIQGGESSQLLAHAPLADRARLAHATLASYAHGLDVVLFIGGVLALASAVGAVALIRTKDFEASSQRSHVPDQPVSAGRDTTAEPAPA